LIATSIANVKKYPIFIAPTNMMKIIVDMKIDDAKYFILI